jgi:hypothetical protein
MIPRRIKRIAYFIGPAIFHLAVSLNIIQCGDINDGNNGRIWSGEFNINLKEVSFSGAGYNVITKDDGSKDYGPPHWQDNSSPLDGDASDEEDIRYPVSFTRNTTMKVALKFVLDSMIEFDDIVKIRGHGPNNLYFPETKATFDGNDLIIADVECSNPFPDEVRFFDPLEIVWEVSPDGGTTWFHAGTSKNQVYVTLSDPLITMYHTLVHIGCTNASQKTRADQVVTKIWSEFSDLDVKRIDGTQLTYWGETVRGDHENPDFLKTTTLLQRGDAKCAAWANFFNDCLLVQGIDGGTVKRIVPKPQPGRTVVGLAINNWDLNANPPKDLPGIPGQNNPNPPSTFLDHAVVQYQDKLYDPSYGGTPYNNIVSWEDTSLAAILYKDRMGRVKFSPNIRGSAETQIVSYP